MESSYGSGDDDGDDDDVVVVVVVAVADDGENVCGAGGEYRCECCRSAPVLDLVASWEESWDDGDVDDDMVLLLFFQCVLVLPVLRWGWFGFRLAGALAWAATDSRPTTRLTLWPKQCRRGMGRWIGLIDSIHSNE